MPDVWTALQTTVTLPEFLELEEIAVVQADRRSAWEAYVAKNKLYEKIYLGKVDR